MSGVRVLENNNDMKKIFLFIIIMTFIGCSNKTADDTINNTKINNTAQKFQHAQDEYTKYVINEVNTIINVYKGNRYIMYRLPDRYNAEYNNTFNTVISIFKKYDYAFYQYHDKVLIFKHTSVYKK